MSTDPNTIAWPSDSWQGTYAMPPIMSMDDLRRALDRVATAFGGHSMYSPADAGRCLAGHIINNGGAAPSAADLAAWHNKRWGDVQAWEDGDDERWAAEVIDAANARLAEASEAA